MAHIFQTESHISCKTNDQNPSEHKHNTQHICHVFLCVLSPDCTSLSPGTASQSIPDWNEAPSVSSCNTSDSPAVLYSCNWGTWIFWLFASVCKPTRKSLYVYQAVPLLLLSQLQAESLRERSTSHHHWLYKKKKGQCTSGSQQVLCRPMIDCCLLINHCASLPSSNSVCSGSVIKIRAREKHNHFGVNIIKKYHRRLTFCYEGAKRSISIVYGCILFTFVHLYTKLNHGMSAFVIILAS